MTTVLIAIFFLVIFGSAAVAGLVAWNVSEKGRRRKLDRRLQRALDQQAEAETDLLKNKLTSDVPVFGRLLEKFEFTDSIRDHLAQANLNWSVGRLIAMMLVSAFLALNILVRIDLIPVYVVLPAVLLCGFLPYTWVLAKRAKRLNRFEEQFPEALDFLARAMRAGHAFSMSLEMLSQEAAEPVAGEFRQTFDEQNLGLPMETSLQNLARRIPLLDVRFFVSAVLLQVRTGGNLSEILDKLAYVIRERFKLRGQVRALSAHGRLTGRILTVMPLVVVVLMSLVNSDYLKILVKNPYGKHLIGAAIIMMFAAWLMIRKIVNIKV